MKTTNYNVRLNPEIKSKAENIFSMCGLNLSQAVNLFLHRAIMVHGLPFEVKAEPEFESDEYLNSHPMLPHITEVLLQTCEDIDNGMGEGYSVDEVDEMLKDTIRRAANEAQA